MTKAFAAICTICLIASMFTGTAFAAGTDEPASAVIVASDSAELLPVDVITNAETAEIRKVYELSPDENPDLLPREDFERNGYSFTCSDILREVVIGEEQKTATVAETAESKKNDMNTILGLFPQYKEYTDEDGFSGTLLLNTSTIKSEIAGYGSSSTPYTVSRSYPNLSDTDTQHLPKTIDDNGRTLQLQDVQWQTDNTMNVDDYEIGDRFTAIVTYGGTKTSSYVSGYTITADYSGEVLRKGVTIIRYTVIFTGTEIPAPEPTPAEPDPSTSPDSGIESEAENNKNTAWLPTLLSGLALIASGACVYTNLKKRKESSHYEKTYDYDFPDTYVDDAGGDPGVGDGDC